MRDALEEAREPGGRTRRRRARARSSSRPARPRRSTPPSGAPAGPRPGAPVLVRRRRALGRPRRLGPLGPGRDARRWTAPDGSTSTRCATRLQSTALPRPALVHCQWANHEVGTLQPVHEVVELCREAGVTVHVDAAAACGHVPTDLGALDADLVSVSAHKLGGVPGAGALVVRRGSRFEPLLVGGEQERGRRGGLEAVPGPPGLRRRGRGAGRRRRPHRRGGGRGAAADRAPSSRPRSPSRASRSWARRSEDAAPPPRLPRRARRRGRAGADRPRPGGRRRALGLGVLVGEHRAVAGARGHGGRPEPLAARHVSAGRRPTRTSAPRSPGPSATSSPICGPYGAEGRRWSWPSPGAVTGTCTGLDPER